MDLSTCGLFVSYVSMRCEIVIFGLTARHNRTNPNLESWKMCVVGYVVSEQVLCVSEVSTCTLRATVFKFK